MAPAKVAVVFWPVIVIPDVLRSVPCHHTENYFRTDASVPADQPVPKPFFVGPAFPKFGMPTDILGIDGIHSHGYRQTSRDGGIWAQVQNEIRWFEVEPEQDIWCPFLQHQFDQFCQGTFRQTHSGHYPLRLEC